MRTSTLPLLLALSSTLACPWPATDTTPTEPTQQLQPEPTPAPTPEPTPPSGTATLTADSSRSTVGFAVARATTEHLGTFEDFDATLELAEGHPVALVIHVKTGSVVADRTGLTSHLKSADFFHVDKFPTATFTADQFTPDPETGPDAYKIEGTMRLHGVGRKLEFPATLETDSDRVVARATLDISAKAFGINYEGMEAELADDAVQLEIELVFLRVADPPEG